MATEFYRPEKFASGHGEQGEPATATVHPVVNETSAGNSDSCGTSEEREPLSDLRGTSVRNPNPDQADASGYQAPPAGRGISLATQPGQTGTASVNPEGAIVQEGAVAQRVSSVPEAGFKKPRNLNEFIELARVSSDILFNAYKHASKLEPQKLSEAEKILGELHTKSSNAFVWLSSTERWTKSRRAA